MAEGPRAHHPPPYSGGGDFEPRDPLDCWACAVLVTAQNLLVATFNLLLLGVVLGTILLPALLMLGFGFLCHSKFLHSRALPCTAHFQDPGFTVLLVVGFLLLVPLLILGLAGYRRLYCRLRLADCLVPYSRAIYQNGGLSHSATLRAPRASQSLPTATSKVWV